MVDRPQALVLTYPHLFWTNVGGIQDNVADNSITTKVHQQLSATYYLWLFVKTSWVQVTSCPPAI